MSTEMTWTANEMYDTSAAGPANELLSAREKQELLKRCLVGDCLEYGLLVRRYRRLAWAAIDAVTPDEQAIPDLVQDTFVRAYEKLHTWRTEAAFSSWLYRIARNIALNPNRSLRRRPCNEQAAGQPDRLVLLNAPEEASPESSHGEASRLAALDRVQARLDEKYRMIRNLHYMSGMTYAALSDALGLQLNTVSTGLKRGRERLMAMARNEGWQ